MKTPSKIPKSAIGKGSIAIKRLQFIKRVSELCDRYPLECYSINLRFSKNLFISMLEELSLSGDEIDAYQDLIDNQGFNFLLKKFYKNNHKINHSLL